MWSFGCILAELYTGYPLFPGENEMEQLALMMEMKGVPDDKILAVGTSINLRSLQGRSISSLKITSQSSCRTQEARNASQTPRIWLM